MYLFAESPRMATFLLVMSVAVIVVITVAVLHPSVFLSRAYITGLLGFLCFALLAAYLGTGTGAVGAVTPGANPGRFLMLVSLVCLFLVFYLAARNNGYLNFMSSVYLSYLTNAIGALILLVALALVYVSAIDSIKGATGATGFAVNLLFALPCYLVDFSRYLLGEYATTTRTTALLLAAEAALIAAWFGAPAMERAWTMFTRALMGRGVHTILGPLTYLNRKTVVANTVHAQVSPEDVAFPKMRNMGAHQMYSLRMDLYLVPVDVGADTEYPIFVFGKGAPGIFYTRADATPLKNGGSVGHRVRVQLSGAGDGVTIPIATQKWVRIQINYANNGADVIVDGALVHHTTFSSDALPVYTSEDAFVFGNDARVAIGAVREVVYFDQPQNAATRI